jgi:type I restriction enzyme M protein
LEHKLVRTLLPDYLQELADAQAKKADLEGQIETAKPSDEEGDDAAEAEDDRPTEEQLKAIKKDLAAMRKDIKKLEAALLDRLDEVRAGLGAVEIQAMVLDLFHADLAVQLDRYVGAHRQQIVEAVENWWDKYKVTLQDIEGERDGAARRLKKYLDELGYQQ